MPSGLTAVCDRLSEVRRDGPVALFRGRHVRSGREVLVKTVARDALADAGWLRRETAILHRLRGPGILECVEAGHGEPPFLVLGCEPDVLPLREVLERGPLGPAEALEIAAAIAAVLVRVHAGGVLHRDLRPETIGWSRAARAAALLDLGQARELGAQHGDDAPAIALAYTSPEQTGRIHRPVDARSDLYSLGVITYELVTGQHPFPSRDAMELVHAHLARTPAAPHERVPSLPRVVSRVVLRLLAKNAEDRYQSAAGALADLERSRRELADTGGCHEFELGAADRPVQLRVPDRLYGRAAELGVIEEALREASLGRASPLFIVGPSGIGKSALAHRLRLAASQAGGLYLEGKFDQLQRDVPYSALRRALRGLVRHLLARSDDEVARWRARIAAAIGGNGQLILDLVPELTSVIGPQPPCEPLTGADAERRLHRVMTAFVGALAGGGGPVVLFLDDLQWIDGATLGLLRALTGDPARRCLLVGAYRDAEVPPEHPLAIAIRALEQARPVHTVALGPLSAASVAELLGDTLRAGLDEVAALAELVHHRTGGNPFFIAQLLDTLHRRGLVTYADERTGWRWDLAAIRAAGITEDVVALMIEKLRRLPPAAQQVIRTGACIGNVFPVSLLAAITRRDRTAVQADLDPSIEAGFVTADGDDVRFLHDRIQQAAYALIPEQQRDEFHLEVGRLLLAGIDETEHAEHVFAIVLHLNRARRLITSPAERRRLLDLNVIAAERARSAVAFAPFLDLIQVAAELLPDDAWTADRALAVRIHLDLAEACFLNRQYERVERHARAVLDRSPSPVDAIRATSTLVLRSMAQGQPKEASRIGLALLNDMGFGIPLEPTRLDIARAVVAMRVRLAPRSFERLAERPETTDPVVIATAEFCMLLLSPLFYGSPRAFPIVGMKMLAHALRHGYTPISPAPFMMLAIILARLGQTKLAGRFGELSWRLQRRFGSRKVKLYLHTGFTTFLSWRSSPYREVLDTVENDAYPVAVDVGNTEFIGHQLMNSVELRFISGDALSELGERCDRMARQIEQYEQWVPLDAVRIMRQMIANLTEGAPDPADLRGPFFDPDEVLPRLVRDGNPSGVFGGATFSSYIALVFGDAPRALRLTLDAEPLLPELAVWYMHTVFVFVQSIALLQAGPPATLAERRLLRRNRALLREWSAGCPANHAHLALLVDAELASRRGRAARAAELYERAAGAAGEHGIVPCAALARELYAAHLLRGGQASAARDHLLIAHRAYRAWGAHAKVRQLEDRHPAMFAGDTADARAPAESPAARLDLESAWKASRAVSGEIVLKHLLRRLIEVIVENAGAVSGELILDRRGEGWKVEASVRAAAGAAEPEIQVLQGLALGAARLPLSVVNYVIRSGESVVLDDAGADPSFGDDPYFASRPARSVLALPIMTQGKLAGVLYLENPVIAGAFTAGRVEFLTLLAGQAAVSLENALLYDGLERQVDERTRELRKLQEIALANAHHAGMAEIATDVLHNVGNVLTHVKVSCDALQRVLESSRLAGLDRVAALVAEQGDRIGEFFASDPKGRLLPGYLVKLSAALQAERAEARAEVEKLASDITRIEEVIASQQDHARGQLLREEVDLSDVVEEVIAVQGTGLRRKGVQVVRDYRPVPRVLVQRTKLTHALVHVLKNAEEAMAGVAPEERVIRIEVGDSKAGEPCIRVSDRGEGIAADDLARIFAHGFTTRPPQRGFGLHFCANTMAEMGGRITAESGGPGRGATFTLAFSRPAGA